MHLSSFPSCRPVRSAVCSKSLFHLIGTVVERSWCVYFVSCAAEALPYQHLVLYHCKHCTRPTSQQLPPSEPTNMCKWCKVWGCYGRGCSSAHGVEVTRRLNLMMNSSWNTMDVCLPPRSSERQLPNGGLRFAVIPLLCCCTRCLLGVLGDWVGRRMNEWAGGCRAAVAFRSPPILMLLCGDG